jgi:hypothetical protein
MTIAIRNWMAPAAWFIAGVFATGSLWYFLSQRSIVGTALSGISAAAFVALAIYLHQAADASAARHRAQLAAFLSEAQGLQSRLNEHPLPVAEHNAWVERVRQYLSQNLGAEFEVRFGDFSGMVFYGDGSERSQFSRSLDGRSRRLNQFIEELGRRG